MDNKVTDEDFVMILITSLLELWDNYTSSYWDQKETNWDYHHTN